MQISVEEYQQRRQKFLTRLPKNSIAILPSTPIRHKSGDANYLYQPETNLYYLTGYKEENCVAVFIPGRTEGEFILFNMPKIREKEIWTGFRVGQEGAKKTFGANQAFVIDEFQKMLPELLQGREKLYFTLGKNPQYDTLVINALNQLKAKVRAGIKVPQEIVNVEKIIFEMRLIKSAGEIAVMREAAQISVEAHKRAMKACKPEANESLLAAELMYGFLSRGCSTTAYDSIVASGANGVVLHYQANDCPLKAGELVLMDAGGQYQYYTSDITTTFPVNGKFTPEQKIIYDLVLKAQHAVFAHVKPGVRWWSMQEIIFRIFEEGLSQLGILKDKDLSKYYMHNSGHWIGLDTHDVGAYKVESEWRELKAGMVLTVEPGLYLSKDVPGLDSKWHDMAVRIEDDVLVTETGIDILSKGLPRTTEEIEAFMKS